MNYYAVRVGKIPGIYSTWEECKAQVHGFPNAQYKKFANKKEALLFMGEEVGLSDYSSCKVNEEELIAYVDGSYNIVTKVVGAGVVLVHHGKVIQELCQSTTAYASMRNVSGEVLASRLAMEYAVEHGYSSLKIYHDYQGIASWCDGTWRAKNDLTKGYKEFYDRQKTKITFHKVDAHTGITLNERADQLAKKAAGV